MKFVHCVNFHWSASCLLSVANILASFAMSMIKMEKHQEELMLCSDFK